MIWRFRVIKSFKTVEINMMDVDQIHKCIQKVNSKIIAIVVLNIVGGHFVHCGQNPFHGSNYSTRVGNGSCCAVQFFSRQLSAGGAQQEGEE